MIQTFQIIMSLCGCFSKRTRNPDAVFLKGCEGDQLSDFDSLLNSPSEQLGQGCFGNTYRVYLEDGTTVTLKRLKGTFSRKNGFKDHMETVRRINHENLVGLEAYFCSRNDTFLVYDYLGESSSVASLLHGMSLFFWIKVKCMEDSLVSCFFLDFGREQWPKPTSFGLGSQGAYCYWSSERN